MTLNLFDGGFIYTQHLYGRQVVQEGQVTEVKAMGEITCKC